MVPAALSCREVGAIAPRYLCQEEENTLRQLMKVAVAVSASSLALAACGSSTSSETSAAATGSASASGSASAPATSDVKVGMAYDVGGRGDQSFNDAAAAGLDKAKAEFGVVTQEATAVNGENESAREERLNQLVDAGFTNIVAVGFAYAGAIGKVAAEVRLRRSGGERHTTRTWPRPASGKPSGRPRTAREPTRSPSNRSTTAERRSGRRR